MARPRILLADDHPEMLKALLGVFSELGEVVGAVSDGEALVRTAQQLKPDIIFTDISMPRMNGLDATRAIQVQAPGSRVVVLTSYEKLSYVTKAFKAGACGYILKTTALHAELPQALLHVLAGDRYIGLGVRRKRKLGGRASTSWPTRTERAPMCSGVVD